MLVSTIEFLAAAEGARISKEAWSRGSAAVSLTDHATDVNPFLILYVIYQDWD